MAPYSPTIKNVGHCICVKLTPQPVSLPRLIEQPPPLLGFRIQVRRTTRTTWSLQVSASASSASQTCWTRPKIPSDRQITSRTWHVRSRIVHSPIFHYKQRHGLQRLPTLLLEHSSTILSSSKPSRAHSSAPTRIAKTPSENLQAAHVRPCQSLVPLPPTSFPPAEMTK